MRRRGHHRGPDQELRRFIIATPKLPAGLIADIRKLAEEFGAAHAEGGYEPRSQELREFHLDRFVRWLEGTYDPATDKGKRLAP